MTRAVVPSHSSWDATSGGSRRVWAVSDRDLEADRTVTLPLIDAVTRTACREERSQVCRQIRLALAEVRRRTPLKDLRKTPGGRCRSSPYVGLRRVLLLFLLLPLPLFQVPENFFGRSPKKNFRRLWRH